MTTDAATLAAYRAAFAVRGVPVTVLRAIGVAPNATFASADVTGVVTGYSAEGGENYAGPGQISRGVRQVLLLADDLEKAGFPLPLRKNDKIVLAGSTEQLNVDDPDAETRRRAGAVECKVSGVA